MLVDDILDTAGTPEGTAHDASVPRVYAAAMHGGFSGQGLTAANLEPVVVTDAIPLPADGPDFVRVLSCADVLALAI